LRVKSQSINFHAVQLHIVQLSNDLHTQTPVSGSCNTNMAESRELHIISSLTWPEASVNTAIQELLNLTSAAASSTTISKSDALSTHVNNTWQALMERIVVHTPSSQQAVLVDFVRTLQQQKVIDPATGDQLRFDPDYNETLWTDVPLFGINVADYWNCGMQSFTQTPMSLQNTTHHSQTPTRRPNT
jgi:hypothetical protein